MSSKKCSNRDFSTSAGAWCHSSRSQRRSLKAGKFGIPQISLLESIVPTKVKISNFTKTVNVQVEEEYIGVVELFFVADASAPGAVNAGGKVTGPFNTTDASAPGAVHAGGRKGGGMAFTFRYRSLSYS